MGAAVWAVMWSVLALVLVGVWVTGATTMKHLGWPSVKSLATLKEAIRSSLPLRISSTLGFVSVWGAWLTWAALTTSFAKGSAMNICAAIGGAIVSLVGLTATWVAESNDFAWFVRMVWPMVYIGWLPAALLLHSCHAIAQGASRMSLVLADRLDGGERRLQARRDHIREMEDELGMSGGRLLELPELMSEPERASRKHEARLQEMAESIVSRRLRSSLTLGGEVITYDPKTGQIYERR